MNPMIGQVEWIPYDFVPYGWLVCDGRLLKVSDYQALATVLRNRFGGDGLETFALPHLTGRTVVGMGKAPDDTFDVGRKGPQYMLEFQGAYPTSAPGPAPGSAEWPCHVETIETPGQLALTPVICFSGEYPQRPW